MEHCRNDILVVDDKLANLNLLSGMLKDKGFAVRPVRSGATALRAAEHQRPDLMLLDIDMPDMDGYSVCEAMKSNPDLQDVPIIFVSALDDAESKVRAFANGGVDYITKPYQIDEVNARIETHLRMQHLQDQMRARNQELAEKNSELNELRELRDNLTSMIVHDLRSPLSGVFGYLELLDVGCAGELDSDAKQYVSKAIKGCRNATELVDSLLEITRLEQAENPIHTRRVNLKQLIQDAIDNVESLCQPQGICFEYPQQPASVLCDPALTRRVMTNLLHNAIDFTAPGGQIKVVVECRGDRVRVTVHDDGPGIAARYHNAIFLKFTQLANGSDKPRRVGGLGLAFCKLAVESQSGIIGVDSEPGQGSHFWFELPGVNGREESARMHATRKDDARS